ncbi:Protein smg8 [Frankliniella fusca]|uniref:Protein smg8 n=1 Tax=Frankliniella fusca TaxID=407009 RepID=A0AAE1HJP2_9NEOP|nr:Protein smg8 [Frankliniella fusca]KAK3922453.1 Protein smg8 [Frankliniella fusca]
MWLCVGMKVHRQQLVVLGRLIANDRWGRRQARTGAFALGIVHLSDPHSVLPRIAGNHNNVYDLTMDMDVAITI